VDEKEGQASEATQTARVKEEGRFTGRGHDVEITGSLVLQ